MKRKRDGECSGCERGLGRSVALDLEIFIEGLSRTVQKALDIRNMRGHKSSSVYNRHLPSDPMHGRFGGAGLLFTVGPIRCK
jgi:hypothetical protein